MSARGPSLATVQIEVRAQDFLPFVYLDKSAIIAAGPYKSTSDLAKKIREGKHPAPVYVGGKALWRSDVYAEFLQTTGEQAEADLGDRQVLEQTKARRLVKARKMRKPPEVSV